MSTLENLYAQLPVLLQDLAISIYGLKLALTRYGTTYRHELARLQESNGETDEFNQMSMLRDFLNYAKNHSNYYRKTLASIDINAIKSTADLCSIPILEKEDLRQNIAEVMTLGIDKGIAAFTGGTSGKSLQVIYEKSDLQKRMAYLAWFESQHGATERMKRASFNGRELIKSPNHGNRFWRNNWPRRQRLYSTFHINQTTIPTYISDLEKFSPEIINGFVSAIHLIADYIVRNDIKHQIRPKVIFTTSETLTDQTKSIIEAAFDCPVINQYASSEGAPFITECPHRKLHYRRYTGIIESIDGQSPSEMLVTSFTTRGTPLIRYRIGDLWTTGTNSCPCGSRDPVVESIDGRAVDYLEGPNGRQISLSHLADILKGLPNGVIQTQFIQTCENQIEIHIVTDKSIFNVNVDMEKIRTAVAYRFGDSVMIPIKIMESIPTTTGGKIPLIRKIK